MAVALAQLTWMVSSAAALVLLPSVAAETEPSARSRSAQVARVSFVLRVILAAGLVVSVLAAHRRRGPTGLNLLVALVPLGSYCSTWRLSPDWGFKELRS